jgi:hypothetical protein
VLFGTVRDGCSDLASHTLLTPLSLLSVVVVLFEGLAPPVFLARANVSETACIRLLRIATTEVKELSPLSTFSRPSCGIKFVRNVNHNMWGAIFKDASILEMITMCRFQSLQVTQSETFALV